MPTLAERLDVIGTAPFPREVTDRYWEEHRQEMRRAIGSAMEDIPESGAMAVVGAGACRDLDLVELASNPRLGRMDLVDLDAPGMEEALCEARARLARLQPEEGWLQPHPLDKVNPVQVEITGVMESFLNWMDQRAGTLNRESTNWTRFQGKRMKEWLAPILEFWRRATQVERGPEELRNQYDLTLSDCILSQLWVSVERAIEAQLNVMIIPPRNEKEGKHQGDCWKYLKAEIPKVVGGAHLKTLVAMTRPGGQILVVSDQHTLRRYRVPSLEWRGAPPEIKNAMRVLSQDEKTVVAEELRMDPRMVCYAGNLGDLTRWALPHAVVLGASEWVWNRQPWEIAPVNTITQAERVQAVRLRVPA